jgi:hypothetical protein
VAGRGAPSFKKRQKEQQWKEKQQEKFARRLERRQQNPAGAIDGAPGTKGAENVEPQIASDGADGGSHDSTSNLWCRFVAAGSAKIDYVV